MRIADGFPWQRACSLRQRVQTRTCEESRSTETGPRRAIRAEDGTGVERRVLELGADDYIVKPFDPEILLSRVNAVFRRLKVMAA